jgi:hypothetical protein
VTGPPTAAAVADPAWTVALDGDPRLERVAETLLTLADGRFGTRGAPEEDGVGATPLTVATGVYDGAEVPALLPGPVWTGLEAPRRTAATAACSTSARAC